ncbi:MAG: paraquat-inducible protein A [Limisphaerales bacterium]
MISREELALPPSGSAPAANTVACEICGLVQQVAEVPEGCSAQCARCGFHLQRRRANSRLRTLTFSLAALILYFPSNIYPLVTAEYHGFHSETTILQGIRSLFQDGQYFIAGLVLCTSIISPIIKIIGLLALSLTLDWPRWKKPRAWIYRIIRIIDPWNMLEVFLLAICVSMIEMGRVAAVHPGRGVFSFTAVVALTLLGTLSFDPRLLWDSPQERQRHE